MLGSALDFSLTANAHGVSQPETAAWPHLHAGASHLSLRTSANYRRYISRNFRPVRFCRLGGIKSESKRFDIIIAGAGIIGLTIARQFLLGSNLSVAVVDARVPCAGATGAGQGYIWRIHKSPENEKWELSLRSHQLWEDLAESVQSRGLDPTLTLGWMKTGSLLVGRTSEDCSFLHEKVLKLTDAGLNAKFLSHDDLLSEEPALKINKEGGAAFMPDDCQIDAKSAVAFIERENRAFAAERRYAEFYHDPVINLLRSMSDPRRCRHRHRCWHRQWKRASISLSSHLKLRARNIVVDGMMQKRDCCWSASVGQKTENGFKPGYLGLLEKIIAKEIAFCRY